MPTPTLPLLLLVAATACARDRPMPQAPAPPPVNESAAITGTDDEPPAQAPPAQVPPAQAPPVQAPPAPPRRADLGPSFLVDPGAPTSRPVQSAIAVLTPTAGHRVAGTVQFRETARGLEVVAEVRGLGPGAHAYHVHVFGDCSASDAASAGPHFHFSGSAFDEEVPFITGNLGELEAARGSPQRAQIEGASLQGPYAIIGRSVVVHAHGNDPDVTPDGGAGDRVACGVIGVAQVPVDHTAHN